MVAFSICATVIQKNYRTVEEVLVCRCSIIDQAKIVFNEHIKNKGSFFNYVGEMLAIIDPYLLPVDIGVLRIQIQKGRKVLLWNQVKSRIEACYSELILPTLVLVLSKYVVKERHLS